MADWRNLPAGLELDALVAERVLGWRWVLHAGWQKGRVLGALTPIPPTHWPICDGEYETCAARPANLWADWDRFLSPLHLTTSIPGAWLVVEALERRGWEWELTRCGRTDCYGASFVRPYVRLPRKLAPMWSATAPLAICRAALAAMETEVAS